MTRPTIRMAEGQTREVDWPSNSIFAAPAPGAGRDLVAAKCYACHTFEARVGNESVGAAPIASGLARVLAVFDAPQGGEVPITLHFLPPAPWWEPGEPLTVNVRVAPPSPWRRLPWVIAALLIAIAFFKSLGASPQSQER